MSGGARRLARALAIFVGAVVLCGADCGPRTERPNVLVLVMDTTRADRCSFLGYESPTTPNLSRLAAESVRFTDAWSPSSWTFPAHAALFTGRRPFRLGVGRARMRPLAAGETTLAEALRDAGWSTGLFTCNGWLAPYAGLTQGFERVDPLYLTAAAGAARLAHRRAIDWMLERRSEGRRFFACINDVEPHSPWNPPADVAARFIPRGTPSALTDAARALLFPRTMLMQLGLEPLDSDLRSAVSALYDGEIATLDAEIGTLIDEMRRQGLLETTLVVVLGDHGEGLGDHGLLEHGLLLHRELLHVPLLVRPPGGTEARAVDAVVRLEDVFPTVLGACAVRVPDGTDGLPLLGTGAAAPSGRVALAAERFRLDLIEAIERATSVSTAAPLRTARRSIYDGRHHLIADDHGRVELYDVKADPAERSDLSAARPDLVEVLRAQLDPE
ncbi:MAG: sulfatase [Planctomycetes bacterium]|nr:sulfatase [Planctomycetota bacterium]